MRVSLPCECAEVDFYAFTWDMGCLEFSAFDCIVISSGGTGGIVVGILAHD